MVYGAKKMVYGAFRMKKIRGAKKMICGAKKNIYGAFRIYSFYKEMGPTLLFLNRVIFLDSFSVID
jgi:hypothetical protein